MSDGKKSCSTCSAELAAESAYCHRCGRRIEGGAKPSVEPDEQVVWAARYHGRARLGAWFLTLVWGGGAAVAYWKFGGGLASWTLWAVLGVALAPLVWVAIRTLGAVLHRRYRVTTHRVVLESGVLGRVLREMLLEKVTDVSVRSTFFERLVNCGSVIVFGSDPTGLRIDFEGVERPLKLRETIRDLSDRRRRDSGAG